VVPASDVAEIAQQFHCFLSSVRRVGAGHLVHTIENEVNLVFQYLRNESFDGITGEAVLCQLCLDTFISPSTDINVIEIYVHYLGGIGVAAQVITTEFGDEFSWRSLQRNTPFSLHCRAKGQWLATELPQEGVTGETRRLHQLRPTSAALPFDLVFPSRSEHLLLNLGIADAHGLTPTFAGLGICPGGRGPAKL
jgi:hypothetical protein